MHFGNLFSFFFDNWQSLVAAFLAIVAAASILIKALEALVSILVKFFPSLKTIDGELQGIAGLLDSIANSTFLKRVSLAPKAAFQDRAPVIPPDQIKTPLERPKVSPVILFLLISGFALRASPARAELTYAVGPTVPLLIVDLDSGSSAQVLSGAGVQLSLSSSAVQRVIMGKAWDLLDLVAMGFGTRVQPQSLPAFGQFSAAIGVCTLSSLVCGVFGKHIVDTSGGIEGKTGWFVGANLSINFGITPEPPPLTGTLNSADGLPRGNTLYFSTP